MNEMMIDDVDGGTKFEEEEKKVGGEKEEGQITRVIIK